MPHKKIAILSLGLLFAVASVQAGCCYNYNCGLGPGEDVCSEDRCEGPIVVRPQELPKPPPLAALAAKVKTLVPIPGPCTCTKAIVKPAIVPRPVCAPVKRIVTSSGCQSQCSSSTVSEGVQYVPVQNRLPKNCRPIWGEYQPVVTGNPAAIAPADPVSLSIAYKLAQKTCVHNEDKLAFGFTKLPKELPPVVKSQNNVPEEQLFKLNGQIVELRPVTCGSSKSLAEEAVEDLLEIHNEQEDEAVEASDIKKVSLGEIGYAPAKIKAAPFINVPLANPLEAIAETALNLRCENKGLVPGKVVFQTVPKPQPIIPPINPVPCESLEEFDEPQQPQCSGGGAYFTHSSSSSSNTNKHHKVVFHKYSTGCL